MFLRVLVFLLDLFDQFRGLIQTPAQRVRQRVGPPGFEIAKHPLNDFIRDRGRIKTGGLQVADACHKQDESDDGGVSQRFQAHTRFLIECSRSRRE